MVPVRTHILTDRLLSPTLAQVRCQTSQLRGQRLLHSSHTSEIEPYSTTKFRHSLERLACRLPRSLPWRLSDIPLSPLSKLLGSVISSMSQESRSTTRGLLRTGRSQLSSAQAMGDRPASVHNGSRKHCEDTGQPQTATLESAGEYSVGSSRCRDSNILIFISGGHTVWAGASNIEEGIAIDLGLLTATTYNPGTNIASLLPGARWADVYAVLEKRESHLPRGPAPTPPLV